MIFMDEEDLKILFSILNAYPYSFYAFGSRVKGTQKSLSDLDLCYMDPIPDAIISELQGQFEDSDLPFKVDLVNFNQCSSDFQKHIRKDLVKIK